MISEDLKLPLQFTYDQIAEIQKRFPLLRYEEYQTASADVCVGSIVTRMENPYDIDVALSGDTPYGVVIGTLFPEARDMNDPFCENEWVRVLVLPVHILESLQIYSRTMLPLREKSFKINDLITLKLIYGKTEIFVANEHFKQCKFLLLNLEKGESYDQIESIDEAAEKLGKEMEYNHTIIPPEVEFWGHCSNLQAWYENNYDTRLIHTNLGFPLLLALITKGDKKAEMSLKEEMVYRIEQTGYNGWIITRPYHYLFTIEEREAIKNYKIYEDRYLSCEDDIMKLKIGNRYNNFYEGREI